MQGCRQQRWCSQHSPYQQRVYRTVAITIVTAFWVMAMVQGCRGDLELSKGFMLPSSGAGSRAVRAARSFSRNYLSASADHAGISSCSHDVGSLERSTDPGKAVQPRAVLSTRTDDLLIEALITAAPEAEEGDGGEGCKAALGELMASSSFYFTKMIVTAYCPLKCCCGLHADTITASGHRIAFGDRFVAAPREYPFGTVFDIPGYGNVGCIDRGGAIVGNKLDVYFDTHTEARGWGIKTLIVKVTAAKDAAI